MNANNRQTPTRLKERIEFVDILRGFALIGVLLMNMNAYSGHSFTLTEITGTLDKITVFFLQFFLQAKFYSLFSFLFGWGMSIQLERAQSRGSRFIPYYLRRNLILLGIGLIHAFLIWSGDILVSYALLSFLLLLFRNQKPRTILIFSALFLALSIVLALPGETMDAVRSWYNLQTDFLRQYTHSVQLYVTGSYGEILGLRREQVLSLMANILYWFGNVFSMFLLGLYVGKRGIFKKIDEHRALVRKVMWVGLIVGLVFNGIFLRTNLEPSWVPQAYRRLATSGARTIGAPALMLFYVSAIILLLKKETWQSRLIQLAPVGRMALSNYLGQSVICTLIFYGYGLGLYGQISPTVGLILSIFIYIGQMRFSAFWLTRYQFGPVEWLWRSLAYGKRQPLSRGLTYTDLPPSRWKKVTGLIRKIPQKYALIGVWVILIGWAAGLAFWNQHLRSQGFYDPFTVVVRVTPTPEGGQASAPETEGEQASLATPVVEPLLYAPGPIASSGDMLSLATALDIDEALAHIEALADPVYEGRYAGTTGGYAAGEYIAEQFAAYGLQPAGIDGSFFQSFPIYINQLSDVPSLVIETSRGVQLEAALYQDFSPVTSRYLGSGDVHGPIYWGDRCDSDTLQKHDLVGKVLLCQGISATDDILATGRVALEYGAAGLLLLTDPETRPADFGSRYYLPWVPVTIPAFRVYPEIIDEILSGTGYDLDDLLASLPPLELESSAALELETMGEAACPSSGCLARNVLGVIPGRDPAFADEVILIGGHYDHMGAAPDGTVWPGADDDASGIAVLLEIARSWQEQGYVPRRTVVFAAWDAEELGLLGASHYVHNPRYPLEDTIAMLQLDMVGAGAAALSVGGEEDFKSQILATAEMLGVEAVGSDTGRSDHIPFWEAGVPAGLLIWWDEGTADYLHRTNDVPANIDLDQLADAARIANLSLLNLAESEPAILALLDQRELAAEIGKRADFLATSQLDQGANDRAWFDDLQTLYPIQVDLEADQIQILGDTANAQVQIRVEYADSSDEDSDSDSKVRTASLEVGFERGQDGWLWSGPHLVLAPGESDIPGIRVWYPPDQEPLPGLGASAWEQYAAVAGKLGLPGEVDADLYLLPDAEALGTKIAFSLSQGLDSWVAPGEVHLVYDPELASSELFATALTQLVLADAGIPRAAAPWLWEGLPLALAAEADPRGIQSALLPDLTAALEIYPASVSASFVTGDSATSPVELEQPAAGQNGAYFPATSWAATEAQIREYGWRGLGAVIRRFGASCQESGCLTEMDLEAAYLAAFRKGSQAFKIAWQGQWKERLQAVQTDLDALLHTRVSAALGADLDAFLRTVDPSVPNLRAAERGWAADLIDKAPEEVLLYGQPLTIYEDGQVLAAMNFEAPYQGQTIQLSYPVLVNRAGTAPIWMGAPFEILSGSRVSVRYPAGKELLAQAVLESAEAELAEIAAALEISPARRLILEIYTGPDSYGASIFFAYPVTERTAVWTAESENIKLYLPPGSYDMNYEGAYRSELAAQIARWLMNQSGIDSEWLLKGVGSLVSRPFDGGRIFQQAGAAYPEILTMLEEDSLPALTSLEQDHLLSPSRYAVTRAVALDSVRYLVESYGWNRLLSILGSYQDAGGIEDAIRGTLGISLSDFEQDWKDALAQGYQEQDWPFIAKAFDGDVALSHIQRLTSPEMGGRQAGTAGDQAAQSYIADQFAAFGLLPAGDQEGSSYFQQFEIPTRILSEVPAFEIRGTESPDFIFREDFSPLLSTSEGLDQVSGELVWVADYTALEYGDVLAGCIVVRPLTSEIELEIELALEHGVVGIIFLGDGNGEQVFSKQPEVHAYPPDSPLPVFVLTRSGTRKFQDAAEPPDQSFTRLPPITQLGLYGDLAFRLPAAAAAPTANVLGFLPGSDPYLKNEIVVIGAHYDYVGDDPGNGLRYSGANDDASGVAGLLEIARVWQRYGYRPKRSVLFAAWGAQELGQAGSGYYVENPVYPLEDIVAVIQLDGIAGGEGFYPGFQGDWESDGQLLFRVKTEEKWVVTPPNTPSDHFSFRQHSIPALLVSWRLASEDNLPDDLANPVSPAKLETCGRMAILLLMGAAR